VFSVSVGYAAVATVTRFMVHEARFRDCERDCRKDPGIIR